MIILDYIKTLSRNAATRFLLEEGYIEEEYVEQAHDVYDRVFIYPYALYNEAGQLIDRIGHVEYGIFERPPGDDFEIVKMEWVRLPIIAAPETDLQL